MSEDLGNQEVPLDHSNIDANEAEVQGLSGVIESGEIKYSVVNTSDMSSIDFTKILTTSPETARKNNDETKAVIKYYGDAPDEVASLNTSEYSIEEIITILEQEEWTPISPDSE